MIEIKEVRDLTPEEQQREAVVKELMYQYQISTVHPFFDKIENIIRKAYDRGFNDGYTVLARKKYDTREEN